MANTRGVFRLTYIIEEKMSSDSWISLSDVWITPSSGISTYRFSDGTLGTPPAATPTPQTYNGSPVNV